jgi:hypothetical protein
MLNLRTGDSIKSVDFLKGRMEYGLLFFDQRPAFAVNTDRFSFYQVPGQGVSDRALA